MSLCVFTLSLLVFVTKCVDETHQHICFLCFHSCQYFRFSENLFTFMHLLGIWHFHAPGEVDKFQIKEHFCGVTL